MKPIRNGLALLLLLAMAACGQREAGFGPAAQLLSNVNIVDVETGEILYNRQVVVDSGKIIRIDSTLADAAGFRKNIDGTGGFLIPGLTEMHAHIPSPPTSEQRIEETLFLYLSNGITTIRGMLGHPYHLNLRSRILSDSLSAPRVFTSSPSLNGNTLPSPEEARAKVTQYAEEGYDFLKIHPGIKRDVFDTLVKTAREKGIPFAGHVPVEVGIRHALNSRYATIDHVDGYLEGLVPVEAGVAPDENGFFGYNFTPLADSSKIDELLALTRENGVWVVPTQSLFERWFSPAAADSLLQQPEMQYMPQATLENWKRIKEQYLSDPAWDPEQWRRFDSIRLTLIQKLQQEGKGLLLGSDAPQLFNVPGFSIHHEIDGMLRAGISPLEILRMGSLYPARFFGQETEWGSIAEGKIADFVLIRSNPLEDLDALKDPEGVMLRGKWHSREMIAARLEQIAENQKAK